MKDYSRKTESFRSAYYAILFLFILGIIGVSGYTVIEGYSIPESLFMTIITMSTVGFQEVRPLSPEGRIFTSFLIIFSFGIFAYVVSTFTRYLVDGVFHNYFKDNKVKKRIKKLHNHVIVCGYGRNGKQAAVELSENNEDFVIIEKDNAIIESIREDSELLYIQGDATNEEVLDAALMLEAKALITTLPIDADNLFIIITARQMNPSVKIISRASDDNSDIKLKRAGADNVIMPDKIGGQRMAKLVVEPDVVEFLEYIMLQRRKDVSLEEVSCKSLSECFADNTIRELGVRNKSGANIIGMKKEDGSYVFNPGPDQELTSKDQLFVLGNPQQIQRLKQLLLEGK